MCVLFFLYMFVKKMRYLRYCDTKAKNWRSDAIYRQKSTIPTTIPYDTECDTISPAVRTRKLTNGVITPFVRYYSLSKVRYRAKKNAIPFIFSCWKKCDTVRYYDTNLLIENTIPRKNRRSFFTPPVITPLAEVIDLVTNLSLC